MNFVKSSGVQSPEKFSSRIFFRSSAEMLLFGGELDELDEVDEVDGVDEVVEVDEVDGVYEA